MSDQKKLSDESLDHIKFFLIFIVSYFLADNIVLLLTKWTPQVFSLFLPLFDNLTYPIVIVFILLVIVRVLSLLIPEINIQNRLSLGLPIIVSLIMTHPILIRITGSNLTVNWLLLGIIEEGLLLQWLLEALLFSSAGYFIYLIQLRSEVRLNRHHRIFRYMANEILNLVIIFIFTFYLIRSFIEETFESLVLTLPFKLVLLTLVYFVTKPLPMEDETEYLNPSESEK